MAKLQPPRNDGAYQAGDDRVLFKIDELTPINIAGPYGETIGPLIEGEEIQFGVMQIKNGTEPHYHPNEQFIYLVSGEATMTIDGKELKLKKGSVAYIPPNQIHSFYATSDEPCEIVTCKDMRFGILGIGAADHPDSK